jgi:hypothetical protein
MSEFSISQPDLFSELTNPRPIEAHLDAEFQSSQPQTGTQSAEGLSDFPDFRPSSSVYAYAQRSAARRNAANVSDEEVSSLLKERQRLLDKKLDGTISIRESNQLEYVRWSLGRVEDAKNGEALDRLEEHVNRYEDFLLKMEEFKALLERSRRQSR